MLTAHSKFLSQARLRRFFHEHQARLVWGKHPLQKLFLCGSSLPSSSSVWRTPFMLSARCCWLDPTTICYHSSACWSTSTLFSVANKAINYRTSTSQLSLNSLTWLFCKLLKSPCHRCWCLKCLSSKWRQLQYLSEVGADDYCGSKESTWPLVVRKIIALLLQAEMARAKAQSAESQKPFWRMGETSLCWADEDVEWIVFSRCTIDIVSRHMSCIWFYLILQQICTAWIHNSALRRQMLNILRMIWRGCWVGQNLLYAMYVRSGLWNCRPDFYMAKLILQDDEYMSICLKMTH